MDPVLSTQEPRAPVQVTGGALVQRLGTSLGGEPEVVLQPVVLRVTGPGRKERAYQDQIQGLEAEVSVRTTAQEAVHRELELARLIERGTDRLTDRLEAEAIRRQEKLETVRNQGKRLMVALGALQGENQVLRGELEAARARELSLMAKAPEPQRSLMARLLGR